MKFDLIDWSAQDLHCFDELAPLLHTERGSGGLPLRLRKADTPGCMMQNGEATVLYSVRAQIWRELGILCGEAEHSDSFFKKEVPCYKDLGVMLDCSRNGVLTTKTVEELIRLLALMGYTSLQLYTEDTYRIDGHPYFGYQRGAYSRDELMQMDKYAAMFGIELVPCIQTLAHLECVLR